MTIPDNKRDTLLTVASQPLIVGSSPALEAEGAWLV